VWTFRSGKQGQGFAISQRDGRDATSGLGGAGTYQLTATGVSTGMLFCPPLFDGSTFFLRGAAVPATGYVLLSTTNLATPVGLWTPIVTNQFDSFGVINITNLFDRNQPHRFFILRTP